MFAELLKQTDCTTRLAIAREAFGAGRRISGIRERAIAGYAAYPMSGTKAPLTPKADRSRAKSGHRKGPSGGEHEGSSTGAATVDREVN